VAAEAVPHSLREASPWIERLARLGFVAKAAVYVIVGTIAARVGFGMGGRTTDTRGAMATILAQPFGSVLLAAVAAGLAGYALWLILGAVLDAEGRGSDLRGVLLRLGASGRGLVHALLGTRAALMVAGSSTGRGDGVHEWTAWLMSAPFGPWLVAAAGASVMAYGGYQLYRVFAADLARHLDRSALRADALRWAVRFGRCGMAARGLVFAVIGFFLIRAALNYDPRQAKGIAEALRTMASRSSPPWLLGAVAVGLVCYGLYQLFEARYRRIRAA
jgi:hypothetical protein